MGKDYQLVVVGGGISGLGLAHLARHRGLECLLLEANERLGGAIQSHRFARDEGPYWAELGAHTCYNSYGNLLGMLEETDQLAFLTPKQKLPYRIETASGLRPIPSQLKLSELLGLPWRLLRSDKRGRSVGDYFGGLIGQQNYRRVLGPALDAVVCQPAADFPAEALFRKKPRRKEVVRSFTGSAGLGSLVDGIAGQPGLEIASGRAVTGIDPGRQGYELTLGDGSRLRAGTLVLAIAPDQAARLLRAGMPELAETLRQIAMAEIESLAVLVRADALELPPLAGIIGRDDDFYSVVSRDPVPDPDYRAFTFHFRPGRLDEAAKLARIRRLLGVGEGAILEWVASGNRLPALRLGHDRLLQRIDHQLAGSRLGMTGNWFSGVSIEDSLARSVGEFARLFPLAGVVEE